MFASAVSARFVVREYLLGVQREMGKPGCVIFEGRDMGTVVFPEADIKFYLDAELDTRALRRYKELAARHTRISLTEVNERLHLLGWEDVDLDYHTLQLAIASFERDQPTLSF